MFAPALAASLLAAFQSAPASAPSSRPAGPIVESGKLPDGVALRVNGEDISSEEFGRWLVATRGDGAWSEFVAGRLIRREAAREKIEATVEEVDRRIDEELDARVKHAFLGDRDKWVREEILALGRTLETWRRERRAQVETDLLAEKILAKRRKVTDADVRAKWEEKHGRGGRAFSFRHVLFEVRYPVGSTASPAEVESEKRKIDEQVRARAAAVRQQIVGGMDFAQAARSFSDDEATKTSGGVAGRYSPYAYGPVFEDAVWSVKKGGVSEPIRGNRGWHLVDITEETITPLESVEAAIRKELEMRRPFATEIIGLKAEVLAGVKVVR